VKKARIGIDCLFAIPGKTSGTWAFARNLLEELLAVDTENEYFVFLNRQAADDFPVRRPNLHLVESRLVGSSVARRLVYQNSILPFLLKRHSLDLLHCLGNYGPVFPLLPLVVTVHDVTWFFDRECEPGRISSGRTAAVDFLLRRSLRRANRIIVDSEFTRRQLVARYAYASSKTTVVYLGLPRREKVCVQEVEERLRGYRIRRPYLVAVGLYLPHKNIGRLIEAFARIKREAQIPHQLVLVGSLELNRENLLRAVRQAGVEEDVVFTGFVPDEILTGIYEAADVVVCPSMMEGFGLPLLEAFANRVPAVCSNAASLPEIAGDAALMFDPLSVEDMARAILEVLRDPPLRSTLVTRGLKRAQDFSFHRAAKETLALYQQILGLGRERGESANPPAGAWRR